MKIASAKDLEKIRKAYAPSLYHPKGIKINVGMASCGIAAGAMDAFDKATEAFKDDDSVTVCQTGCIGYCEVEPLVEILADGKPRVIYKNITADKILEAVEDYKNGASKKKWILGQMRDPRCVLEDDAANPIDKIEPIEGIPFMEDVPFYKNQVKVALRNCGYIDPDAIDAYIAKKGYLAFIDALNNQKPKTIIDTIKDSGLRGRGGGGFPTGIKWATAAKHHGDRYIICNADEGDPGAYMDRSILEGDPHSVLEGMLIAGYAIGSKQGYIYVRNEYPLAVKRLLTAIKQAEAYGLLGDNIAGTDFSFNIKISTGAGAFVCGESTALMASLEGNVGRPRAKYVHTVEKGFRNSPTNLNNVETYANVPAIVLKGAEWYAGNGHRTQQGHQGVSPWWAKLTTPVWWKCPWAVSLQAISSLISAAASRRRKGIQSHSNRRAIWSGCIPGAVSSICRWILMNWPRSAPSWARGGMIVMDQDTCMVDVARYFLEFLKEESCGQCNPCREGIKQMLNILTNVSVPGERAKRATSSCSKRSAAMVQKFSLCGSGHGSPQPGTDHLAVLSGMNMRSTSGTKKCSVRCLQGALCSTMKSIL